jgi:hypothetical protein
VGDTAIAETSGDGGMEPVLEAHAPRKTMAPNSETDASRFDRGDATSRTPWSCLPPAFDRASIAEHNRSGAKVPLITETVKIRA